MLTGGGLSILLLAAVVATLLPGCSDVKEPGSARPNPLLVVSSTPFRPAGEGAVFEMSFVVRNDFDHRVHIDRVEAGCGCTTVQVSDRYLSPGDTANVTLSIDSRSAGESRYSIDAQKGTVTIAAECQVHVDETAGLSFHPLPANFSQQIALPVQLPSRVFDLGDAVVGGAAFERVFELEVRDGVVIDRVECSLPAVSAEVLPGQSDVSNVLLKFTVDPAHLGEISISGTPHRDTAEILLRDAGASLTSLTVPVIFRSRQPVEVTPSVLAMQVHAGDVTRAKRRLRLRCFRRDNRVERLTSIQCPDNIAVDIEQSARKKDSLTVDLLITVQPSAPQTSYLQLHLLLSDGASETIQMPCVTSSSGLTGISPKLQSQVVAR